MANAGFSSGDLDSTFGVGGKVTTSFNSGIDFATSVALQSDGKIVVVGSTWNGTDFDIALTRYQADGSPDTSFGNGGKLTTNFGSDDDFGYNLVVQNDGKIVVVGSTTDGNGSDFILARYNPDGSLDPTFGAGGKVTSHFTLYDDAYSLALQPDGKIWVVGSTINPQNLTDDIALVRYNPNGTSDLTISTDFGANDYGYSLAVQSDGKLVVAGETNNGGSSNFAIVRYNPDGSTDTSFGGSGKITTDFNPFDYGSSVLVQPDGKIIAAGYSSFNPQNYTDFTLVRYNPDGSLDPSFGAGGKVITPMGSSDNAKVDITLQPSGKILVVGAINGDMAIVRYNVDGSLDSGFGGGDGKVSTDFGGVDSGAGVILQGSNILVVGATTVGGGDFAIARLMGNQSPSDITLSNSAVAEGAVNQTVIGTLETIDADTNDPQTYTLLDDAGGRFTLTGNTLSVANGALLDFETQPQHTIRVRSTDSSNTSVEKDLILTVTNVNEAPVLTVPIADQTTTALRPFSFTIADTTFTDIDANDTLTLSLRLANSNSLPNWLRFDAATGNLSGTPSNTDVGSFSFILTETDRAGATATDDFSLTIEPATIVSNFGSALPKINFARIKPGIRYKGKRHSETLHGTYKSDILHGMAGNDRIIAGSGKPRFGRDRVFGGRGNDTIFGGRGNDILDGGQDDDQIKGGRDHDLIMGKAGHDVLVGNAGNDVLVGDTGADTLTGGEGRDTFTFNATTEGVDTITDFNANQDLIDLQSIFAQPEFAGATLLDRFNQFVSIVQVGTNTIIQLDADGNSAGTSLTPLASLQNITVNSLSISNFILV